MALLLPGALVLSGCDLFGSGDSDTAGDERTTTTEEPTTTSTTESADDNDRERAAADGGGEGDEGETETTPTTAPPETEPTTTTTAPPDNQSGGIALRVDVTDGENQLRSATLSCAADSHVASGFLSGSGRSACDFVGQQQIRSRLTGGSQRGPEMACTMIWGGPEVATVTGNIGGTNVDTTFDRVDGCRMSEFDSFEPLIGPSVGMAVE